MAVMEAWGERLTPAFGDTFRRFPFPIVLAAIATGLFLVAINQPVFSLDAPPLGLPLETWMRAAFGVGTAAIFATAGIFFAESRSQSRLVAAVLIYLVPALVGVLFQIRDTTWFVPYALPVIGALWLSVASFVGMPREEAEPRFWWLNHRAIATGAIAGLALGIICVGIVAIERTVATLFGLDATTLIYKFVLPIIGFFFAPLYWLSTLPRLADYDPRVLVAPDFLARAVGLVGKFVLIPLLLAYAAILLAYGAQIAVTQTLPQGTLGWMVLSFVMAGAGTILVLYPPFVRDSAIVRVFTAAWFWLTVPPLVLFAIAVWVRIDAYGVTPERLILVWGGIWAALLTLIFLARLGDIRLIPGLAAIVLALMTFGPWNLENLPRWQQGLRLDVLLSKAGPNGESLAGPSTWTEEERQRAIGAITYLSYGSAQNREELVRILAIYGHRFDPSTVNPVSVMLELGVDPSPIEAVAGYTLGRDFAQPVDVSATPFLVADVYFYGTESGRKGLDFMLRTRGKLLEVLRDGTAISSVDLTSLTEGSNGSTLSRNSIDFAVDGRTYRLVVNSLSLQPPANDPQGALVVSNVDGTLFSATAN